MEARQIISGVLVADQRPFPLVDESHIGSQGFDSVEPCISTALWAGLSIGRQDQKIQATHGLESVGLRP